MQLHIGNKNYSSWSMRPWVLLRHFGIAFDEVMHRFDSFEPDSQFRREMAMLSPTGKVPLLVDGELVVWDTLAIAETLAEAHPDLPLWPRNPQPRARARSLCAEMHSGFGALRSACPMNIEATLPEVGERVLREQAGVRADLARIDALWTDALRASGGPFLFGAFGIVDAYYAPVVARLRSYALPVSNEASAYMARVWASSGVAAWVADAVAEQEFIGFEEPYRSHR